MEILNKGSYLTSAQWSKIQDYIKNRTDSLNQEDYLVPSTSDPVAGNTRTERPVFAAPKAPKTFSQSLLELTTLKEIFDAMMADENRQSVFDLTAEEIADVEEHTIYLYNSILEPTADDDEYKELIVDTLHILPNGGEVLEGDPAPLAITLPSVIEGSDYGLVETGQKGLALSGDYVINGTCLFKSRILVQKGKTLTITGSGNMNIDSVSRDGFFLIEPDAKLILKGNATESIIINGGDRTYNSALWCQGELEMENVLVRDNHFKNYSGAALYVSSSVTGRTIKLTKCRFYNCDAPNGSVISLRNQTGGQGQVIIDKCVFEQSGWTEQIGDGLGEGGIIHVRHDGSQYKLTITNSVFRNNAAFNGAAIHWKNLSANSELYVKDCQFLNNTSIHSIINEVEYGGYGAGVYITGTSNASKVTITGTAGTTSTALTTGLPGTLVGTLFQNNTAPLGGGAIYINSKSPITIENTTINNCVCSNGSAIFLDGEGSNTNITLNSVKVQNCGPSSGNSEFGAICVPERETRSTYIMNINNSTFSNNKGNRGGAIYWMGNGALNISGTTFSNNKAYLDSEKKAGVGGAIYWYTSTGNCQLSNCTFTSNEGTSGGAVYLRYGTTVKINDCRFNNNLSTSNGGAFFLESGSPNITIENCNFNGNNCQNGSCVMIGSGSQTINIKKTIFENSLATLGSGDGGTVRSVGLGRCKLNIDQCIFRNNVSSRGAGVYWNANGSGALMNVKDTQFINNEASINGGALYTEGPCTFQGSNGTLSPVISSGSIPSSGLIGTIIQGNRATERGGGICIAAYNDGSATAPTIFGENNITLGTNVIISGNSAPIGGGVSYNIGNSKVFGDNFIFNFNIQGAKISGNTAENQGGGIFIEYDAFLYAAMSREQGKDLGLVPRVNVNSGEISGNISQTGAGIFVAKGQCNITGGVVKNNASTSDGGAIHLQNRPISGQIPTEEQKTTKVIISGGSLESNTAETNGGAISVINGDCFIESGILNNNIAISKGGACYISNGNIVLGTEECHDAGDSSTHTHPVIINNIANDGAGIYVDGGNTTMWCGDIKYNQAYEGTVNVFVNNGTFTYNGGDIGVPFDTGIRIEGGQFIDNTATPESPRYELHYRSTLIPDGDYKEIDYNYGFPASKWVDSPKGTEFRKVKTDNTTPTWGEVFADKEFIGWTYDKNKNSDKFFNLYALWE